MRRAACLTSLVLCFLSAQPALRAQDPAKIVDQYVKAAGGHKALSKIRTLTIEGAFTNSADGTPGTYTFDTKLPNRYYSEFVVDNKNLIEAYNGKSAWHETPGGEIATLSARTAFNSKPLPLYYNSHLLNPKKHKLALAFIGHAQVRGKDALAGRNHFSHRRQREALLRSAITSHRQGIWRARRPRRRNSSTTTTAPSMASSCPSRSNSIAAPPLTPSTSLAPSSTPTVGERTFDFPVKSQVKLPDLKALFKEIDDNQKAIDKIRENYAGTRVEDRNRARKRRQGKKDRSERVHLLLSQWRRDFHSRQKRRQAPQPRRREERKRKDAKRNRRHSETPGPKRSQGRKSQGRGQEAKGRR